MNANEQLDFYNPDSIYYGNSRHYIQQLEAKVRQQQAEIETLKSHPAELTDEEIIEIGLLTTDPRFSHIESPLLLEFARAILRKA